jgi:large exoprotein involved in heme utilization and adhesion
MSTQPAGIAVQGSLLQVPAGETLSVVGGDIRIADGSLYAPGGRIDMVSVASPGEVIPDASDLGVASFEKLGKIEISHSSVPRPEIAGNEIANVDASGEGGGRIFIRGGEFVADNAFIFADTRGSGEGQGIDIGVTGQITMRNGALITADTLGSGSGGDLTVEAGSLEMRHGAEIHTATLGSGSGGDLTVGAGSLEMQEGAFIGTTTFGSGDGGQLSVEAGSLEMRHGARIAVNIFFGSGSGGDLTVKADKILLSGDFTWIVVSALGDEGGDLGDITVTAGSLEVRNGAGIHTNAHLQGSDVTVTADRLLLSGDGESFTGISSGGCIFNTCILGGGGVGNVTVTAGSLEVRNGAGISAQGNTSRSGNVTVTADRIFLSGDGATETILVDGGETIEIPVSTGINADGFIDAGNVTIQAGSLEVRNGAEISAGSSDPGLSGNVTVTADRVFLSGDGANFPRTGFPRTGIFAEAFFGVAGNVTVTTGNLEVRNGAEISASNASGLGQGGNVKINATDITLQDGGKISAESGPLRGSAGADAGNITLEVRNLLHLSNGSSITTSVAEGEGSGGNIAIDSVFVVLDEGSSIIANAERGQGGNILIRILGGGALFQSPDSLIKASSEIGLEGSVVIDAPDTDIIAGFAGLPANFLDAATVLTQLCAGRSGANMSSLVVRKYEVLPDSPYALRVQLPRAMPAPRTAKQSRAPRTYYTGGPLPPMISCLGNG